MDMIQTINNRLASPEKQEIAQLLKQIKTLANHYQQLTGRPLGITGEIGEFTAIDLLALKIAPVRTPGYDASEMIDGNKIKYQIKTRCIPKGKGLTQRLGQIKFNHEWDAVLFVRLDSNFEPLGIWEASRADVQNALEEPGSKSRNDRGALGVNKFISIAKPRWLPDGKSENTSLNQEDNT
jgi:hypothetical protein